MNRQERIKHGYVGKQTFTDKKTGKKIIIDFDDEERGSILSPEEYGPIIESSIKYMTRKYSELTPEEKKYYTNKPGDEGGPEDDNI